MKRPYINWLITDTHFWEMALVKACGRPENFTELIISNLKNLVAEQDALIHLGDVIYRQENLLSDLLEQINCRSKILVKGNHDKKSNNWYMNHGFDFVCDALVIGNVILSHKPLKIIPDGILYNIHGHFHNFDFNNKDDECAPYYNPEIHKLYALEYEDFKPVNLDKFVAKFTKKE